MGLGSAELSFTCLVPEKIPPAKYPRWIVLGRSNVGKSSFLNALTHPQTLFRSGRTPGVTIGLIAAKVWLSKRDESVLEIVDVPGFGFAKGGEGRERDRWDELMNQLRNQSHEKACQWIWLVDPQRKPGQEEDQLLQWLGREPFSLVFTKTDRVKSSVRQQVFKDWHKFIENASEKPYWVSAQTGDGLKEIFQSARAFVRQHSMSEGDGEGQGYES